MTKHRRVIKFGHDFDAVVVLVCTDRGRHAERQVEVMKRDGRRWFTVSEELGMTARQAREAGWVELADQGDPVAGGKWVRRDGQPRSRHCGGLRRTRGGVEVRCPKCHRAYQFPGVSLYRGLDVLADRDESDGSWLDVSHTGC